MLKFDKKYYKLLFFFLFLILILFLIRIRVILIPFFIGLVLAYLFNPVVVFLEKKNFSRLGAIYLLIIIFVFVATFFSLIIIPAFVKELEGLVEMLPDYISLAQEYVNFLQEEYRRIQLPIMIQGVINETLHNIEEWFITFVQDFTETIINSLFYIALIFIAPIISYYLLKDMDLITKNFIQLAPGKLQKIFIELGKDISKIFVGFLRGQIWVSIIVFILISIGLFFLDIKFSLLLGIFAGVTNMIPYFGPFIGSVPAVFVALLNSPLKALLVIILFVVIQQIESSVIAPKIMSENVGLHPITIILSLLAGAELIGVWGLIFAIPIAGSMKVIVLFIFKQLTVQ